MAPLKIPTPGEVVDAVTGAVEDAAETGGDVIEATIEVAKVPTTIAIDVVQGKDVDVGERIGSKVSDLASATAEAANTPNFLVINLAGEFGGEDAAKVAIAATAGNIISINLLEAIARKVTGQQEVRPEDVATLPASTLLSAALEAASQQLGPLASPIPYYVKQLLRDLFPANLLSETKYWIGSFGLTLPEIINGSQQFMGNHSHAVTVPGVIVFSRAPGQGASDLHWWAHELCHAEQYQRMGVDDFAEAYVKNYEELEREAEAKADTLPQEVA